MTGSQGILHFEGERLDHLIHLHGLEVKLEQIVIDHRDVDHIIHDRAQAAYACGHAGQQALKVGAFVLLNHVMHHGGIAFDQRDGCLELMGRH
jgi:hypothetical protein